MNKIKNIIAFGVFSLMVLALPSMVSAQWSGGYPYPNSGGVFRGGRDLDRVSDRLKQNARDLERRIDREFRNNSRYGNTGILGTILGGGGVYNRGYGNDHIKRLADDFRKAADRFENRMDDNDDRGRRGRYDDDDYYNNGRGRWNRGDSRDIQAAHHLLNVGSQLENELRRYRTSSQLQREWNEIRRDLSVVASAYGHGRGGRNSRFPF